MTTCAPVNLFWKSRAPTYSFTCQNFATFACAVSGEHHGPSSVKPPLRQHPARQNFSWYTKLAETASSNGELYSSRPGTPAHTQQQRWQHHNGHGLSCFASWQAGGKRGEARQQGRPAAANARRTDCSGRSRGARDDRRRADADRSSGRDERR